ncbi:MAG: recA-like protein [Pseudomonadota bacterium]
MPKSVLPSGAKALQNRPVPSPFKEGDALACLSAKDIAALSKAREARWRPGLTDQPWHSEIFATISDASGAGVALALARDALRVAGEKEADPLADAEDRRQVLWVQDKRAIQRGGRPYAQGLPPELRERLIHVEAATPEDALFALEEGLRCRDLACVIGEITGNPRALDFTASRRLSLAAEKHGVALWLVRLDAEPDLSSARMRWRAEPAPSATPRWNADAPGTPAWKAELFRARSHAPGHWILSHETQSDQAGRLTARRPSQTRAKAPRIANQQPANEQYTAAPYSGHLARATVGRSLAACARM